MRETAEDVAAPGGDPARHLGTGGTLLLHDSDITTGNGAWRATLSVLPAVIADCRRRGLHLDPLATGDAQSQSRFLKAT
ncbi:hypothetical protein [Amycolatopsis sp. lyj-23]|uniref:hypothetical protein n=1 Tax=Amycolatopsis sp. lyj-23 TaxID=2789283 RepID=UPI00397ADDF9